LPVALRESTDRRSKAVSDDRPPRRIQSATQRDMEGMQARKERAKSPAVEFVCEDVTGQYEGEELRAMREQRRPEDRISRLEAKHDSLSRVVGATREDVAKMTGKLDTFLEVVSSDRKLAHQTEHVRIGSRAKIIVAIVGAVVAIVTAVLTRWAS
jgi:hypothetical protein